MKSYSLYQLDDLDYQIFQLIYRDPLLSIYQLSQKLNVSFHTVKSRINEMKKHGFLRQDRVINDPLLGERIQTESEIVYLPHRLGLLRTHVLIDGIKDREALHKLFLFSDYHPYTHYNVVSYNPSLSMYIQFDIPPKATSKLKMVLNILQNEGFFTKKTILFSELVSSSPAEFSLWDHKTSDWMLNDSDNNGEVRNYEGRNIFEKMWRKFDFSSIKDAPKVIPEQAFMFDKLDLILLRELTINAKVSVKALSKYYNKDASTISRRIKRIKTVLAPRAKLYYNTKMFNLVSPKILFARFKRGDGFNKTSSYWFIDSHYFKFPSTLVSSKRELIWYLNLLPSNIPDFLEFAWEHLSNVKLYNLQIPLSNTYFFYPENYLGEGKWNISNDWFIDEPLEKLNLRK